MTLLAKFVVIFLLIGNIPLVENATIHTKGEQNAIQSPHTRVLRYTQYYANMYNVPEIYLFRLLNLETGFTVSDTTYNPFSKRILKTRWDGPYQMLTSTARSVWPDTLQHLTNAQFKTKMRFDLEFSVHTAVKYISTLYKKYNRWDTTFSVYNLGPSGERHINTYARKIVK